MRNNEENLPFLEGYGTWWKTTDLLVLLVVFSEEPTPQVLRNIPGIPNG